MSNLLSRRRRSSETGEPSAAAAAACSSGAAVPTASPPPPPSSTATGAGNGVAATEKDKESSEIYGLLGAHCRLGAGSLRSPVSNFLVKEAMTLACPYGISRNASYFVSVCIDNCHSKMCHTNVETATAVNGQLERRCPERITRPLLIVTT